MTLFSFSFFGYSNSHIKDFFASLAGACLFLYFWFFFWFLNKRKINPSSSTLRGPSPPPVSPSRRKKQQQNLKPEVEPSPELLLFPPDHVPGLLRELRHLVPRQQQHVPGAARVLHERQQHDRKPDLYLRLPGTGSADTDTGFRTSSALYSRPHDDTPAVEVNAERAEHRRRIQGGSARPHHMGRWETIRGEPDDTDSACTDIFVFASPVRYLYSTWWRRCTLDANTARNREMIKLLESDLLRSRLDLRFSHHRSGSRTLFPRVPVRQ